MCQRLKGALAERFGRPERGIVLASSATAGFQAIVDMLGSNMVEGKLRFCISNATWPGMHLAIARGRNTERGWNNPDVRVLTDIGGAAFIDHELDREGEIVIHDACHSTQPVHAADFALMSFYPTKLLAGAEGGVIFCRKEEDARALESWLYCGLVPGSAAEGTEPAVIGAKANMTDIQAAYNLEALEGLDERKRRTAAAWRTMEAAAKRHDIPYRREVWCLPYLFQAKVPANLIPQVRTMLKLVGLPTAWNFRPAPLLTLPMPLDISSSMADSVMRVLRYTMKQVGLKSPDQ